MVSNFAEENLIKIIPGRVENYSILKSGPNFSIDLRLNTHYEYKPTTKTISHLVLPVVSGELHTSISEARQKHELGNLALLGLYLHNLPNSAIKYL